MRESTKIYFIWIILVLLLSIFIKGKMIIDYFMGMNEYVSRWNNFPTLWWGLVVLVVVGVYFSAL